MNEKKEKRVLHQVMEKEVALVKLSVDIVVSGYLFSVTINRTDIVSEEAGSN